MLILGIETSCDETAASVVEDGRRVLSDVVASQQELHRKYGGVVPEIASRAHIEAILPVLDKALTDAGVTLDQIDAVGVSNRPGLVGALLVGVSAAKSIAWARHKPLIAVDHVRAHLYAYSLTPASGSGRRGEPCVRPPAGSAGHCHPAPEPSTLQPEACTSPPAPSPSVERGKEGEAVAPSPHLERGMGGEVYPCVALIASGGHTLIFYAESPTEARVLGSTTDDAAGEAFDKVASILELGYPGGPIIDRLARDGNPKAVDFPRSYLEPGSLDFSFSGVKTAVLYYWKGPKVPGSKPPASRAPLPDVVASLQEAIVDVLVDKTMLAAEKARARRVLLGGGVACNSRLRTKMKDATDSRGLTLLIPPPKYCTDNAAMVAGLAWHLARKNEYATLDLEPQPGLIR